MELELETNVKLYTINVILTDPPRTDNCAKLKSDHKCGKLEKYFSVIYSIASYKQEMRKSLLERNHK